MDEREDNNFYKAFYMREVITITDSFDEKVEPKYGILVLNLKTN